MSKNKPQNYVITYISEETAKKYGYTDKRFDYPVFIRKVNDSKYRVDSYYSSTTIEWIPNFMVDKVYTIEEARVKYPEMFL